MNLFQITDFVQNWGQNSPSPTHRK